MSWKLIFTAVLLGRLVMVVGTSGRTGRAADVFQRLNDPRRKSDAALTAFLDATNQHEAK